MSASDRFVSADPHGQTADDRAVPLRATDPASVGKYVLIGRLGEGGMGQVYLGAAADGRRVAVKVMRADIGRDEEFRARFRRETSAARRVARSCTAAVLDADPDAEPPYLVTEYVAGPTLARTVKRSGPLEPTDVEQLAVSVATALVQIHRVGLIHRDLKPSNVLLSPIGPRVIDFGIAHALDATTTLTSTLQHLGTPAYMTPEQVHGDAPTAAVDVFAWAGLLIFAASGRPPFGDTPPALLPFRIVNDEPCLDDIDEKLRPLVTRALAKDPAQRPTARELLLSLIEDDPDIAGAAPPAVAVAAEMPRSEPHADETLIMRDRSFPDPVEERATGQESLGGLTRTLGENHPRTLMAAHNFAADLSDLGDHERAISLGQDTLVRRRAVLGDDDRDTLETAHNLATDLRELGENEAARDLDEDTYTRRGRSLGENHPDTLMSGHNLAGDRSSLGDHSGALRLGQHVLDLRRDVLGENHPDTLETASGVAFDLSEVGDHEAARALDADTLDRHRQTLGEDHPETLTSAHNLAVDLFQLGDNEAAWTLGDEVLERRRNVLGEHHPDTLDTAEAVVGYLQALGNYKEARKLRRRIRDLRSIVT